MNKTALLVVGIFLVLGGAYAAMTYWPSTETTVTPRFDPLNATTIVDGAPMTLENGGTASSVEEHSYLVSSADPLTYCDGTAMDTEAFRKTITVKNALALTDADPSTVEVIKATIAAATTGKCRDVLAQVIITENDGVVTIAPIDGWAGIAITMCSCKPLVEVNILQIPGMKSVVWE